MLTEIAEGAVNVKAAEGDGPPRRHPPEGDATMGDDVADPEGDEELDR